MRRIVLDTNCLVMALPTQSPYHKIWSDFVKGKLEFCVSTEILFEYEEILAKKISQYFAEIVMNSLLNAPNLIRIEPQWRFNLINADPDDNKFVDCAICGNAEYIVSNDKHYAILNTIDFPVVNLLEIKDFVKLIS
ncbi:MAG: putative toxin-antitoxin system toxin component, PIN family [Bacteroidales bacterium]|nr:putative toxin-antitoxin system toxin component, PIN family [Bacteroidales bacterium]